MTMVQMPMLQDRRTRRPRREIPVRPVKLAFVGVGWIGTNRLRALLGRDDVEVTALCDVHATAREGLADECAMRQEAGRPRTYDDYDTLLRDAEELALDGVVLATPTAMHAAQSIEAFEHGLNVFCQKPLSRTCAEARDILRAAARADRLLGVDYSYRGVAGLDDGRMLVSSGALGRIHAVDLAFHNAFGPDKAWFYDRGLSGGGCVMDLGCLLIDLLFTLVPDDHVTDVRAQRYVAGERLAPQDQRVEDFAMATMQLCSGASVRLSCSWRAHVGQGAVIDATVFGTRGAVRLHNREGSFTDLVVEHHEGTSSRILERPDQRWGGRQIGRWVEALVANQRYDAAAAAQFFAVARVMDRINAQ